MTREQVKELLPIMQAFAEGKQIQDKIEGLTDWVDTDELHFQYEGQKIIHRIKPEPECRPFKTKEECWQEMLKHEPFGWIKSKHRDEQRLICSMLHFPATERGIDIVLSDDISRAHKSSYIFDHFTFADGTPFGIKEE